MKRSHLSIDSGKRLAGIESNLIIITLCKYSMIICLSIQLGSATGGAACVPVAMLKREVALQTPKYVKPNH